MPAVALCGTDIILTGHPCDGTALIEGALQSKVSSGGFAVALQGDAIQVHEFRVGIECVPHTAVITGGSSKVFIGGIAVARIGDGVDAGQVLTGSAKIFAGG